MKSFPLFFAVVLALFLGACGNNAGNAPDKGENPLELPSENQTHDSDMKKDKEEKEAS